MLSDLFMYSICSLSAQVEPRMALRHCISNTNNLFSSDDFSVKISETHFTIRRMRALYNLIFNFMLKSLFDQTVYFHLSNRNITRPTCWIKFGTTIRRNTKPRILSKKCLVILVVYIYLYIPTLHLAKLIFIPQL